MRKGAGSRQHRQHDVSCKRFTLKEGQRTMRTFRWGVLTAAAVACTLVVASQVNHPDGPG